RTILTTCWLGVRLLRTAWSIARSRTRSTKAETTLKLTSASSSAVRISRRAASTVSSVRRVSLLSDWKTSWRRVLSVSNMTGSYETWSDLPGPPHFGQTLILLAVEANGQPFTEGARDWGLGIRK